MSEQRTPLDELETVIAEGLAEDPHFYDSPDRPRTASGSNTTVYRPLTEAAAGRVPRDPNWRPFGYYGPNNSPVPLDMER